MIIIFSCRLSSPPAFRQRHVYAAAPLLMLPLSLIFRRRHAADTPRHR